MTFFTYIYNGLGLLISALIDYNVDTREENEQEEEKENVSDEQEEEKETVADDVGVDKKQEDDDVIDLEIKNKKESLSAMIMFCKQILRLKCARSGDCDRCQIMNIFGGFVRDWCIPCMNENLDCMEIDSVHIMFQKYPNFTIPGDIDVMKCPDLNLVDHDFTGISVSPCSIDNINRGYACQKYWISISTRTKIGLDIVDARDKMRCPDDFDCNLWRFNFNRGIFIRGLCDPLDHQRLLFKSIKDIVLKQCTFLGDIKNPKQIDRIRKMLLRGWTIKNLNSFYTKYRAIPDAGKFCTICYDLMNDDESGGLISMSCCRADVHIHCILEWVKRCIKNNVRATCPYCRYALIIIK